MYLFLNRGLGMSVGKSAAQVAHAAVEAFQISDRKMIENWNYGKHYTKLVMLAEDADQLLVIERYIKERGFKTAIIIDEGRTEIQPFSYTALGVEIVDKDDLHVQATFGDFRTYKDLPPKTKERRWWHLSEDSGI
jgi:peptidyl-tRNA hydrolase